MLHMYSGMAFFVSSSLLLDCVAYVVNATSTFSRPLTVSVRWFGPELQSGWRLRTIPAEKTAASRARRQGTRLHH